MRLFVAVDLPAVAVQAIARVQQEIAASFESIRLVRPEQLHITLAFLGDVSDAQVPGVVDTMGAAVGMTPFDLVFSSICLFPPRIAPHECWAEIDVGFSA